MKILHLSDLHIGKTVNDFNMIEDQAYMLEQIIKLIESKAPDAILIAGDIYDKPVPSEEAVRLLDGFLRVLSSAGITIRMNGCISAAVCLQKIRSISQPDTTAISIKKHVRTSTVPSISFCFRS